MRTFKFVACKPLVSHAVQAVSTSSGFIVAASNVNLVQTLCVAYNDSLGCGKGDLVAIRGDQVKQKWATTVYTDCQGVEGKFILVPVEEVIGVHHPEAA